MIQRELKEECGIVGVYGHPEAARLAYLSLYALQHRGQEACGIATLEEDQKFRSHKAFGLVGDAFTREKLEILTGNKAIGHNRYSTHGGRSMQNIQPFIFTSHFGPLAIAHNGNLTNADILRSKLESEGSIFQSTSDTEIFMHLLAKSQGRNMVERIADTMKRVKGAYSLVILTSDGMFAVRDPFGFRPCVLGQKDGCYVIASETCALDLIDFDFLREVEPGEIVSITGDGLSSYREAAQNRAIKSYCSFEPIYFARPDSVISDGRSMYQIRKELGQQLAREDDLQADIVIAMPDSGVPMAFGYSQVSGIPYEVGLVRNHYVGRTFIEPSQAIRDFGVKLKLNPVRGVLKGKRVVVVDDSLVRGTTSVKTLRLIRQAGASEVHMRIASPPMTHSCFFGVDTPSRSQLLAAQMNVEEIRKIIGAETLQFLSMDGLREVLNDREEKKNCYGCFGRGYKEDPGAVIPPAPTDAAGGPGYKS